MRLRLAQEARMAVRGRDGWSLSLAALLLACGAESAPSERPLRVFAPASMAAVLQELAVDYAATGAGLPFALHCAGTPQLVLQLAAGATADLLLAADLPQMQRAMELGVVIAPPQVVAGNHLAIAVAAGNPKQVQGLADLARADLAVVLCNHEVPAGAYARAALRQAGVVVRPVSEEGNVLAAATRVRLGEADAAIVYRTDANLPGLQAIALPVQHDVAAQYWVAATRCGDQAGAARLLAYLRSERARALFLQAGFSLP